MKNQGSLLTLHTKFLYELLDVKLQLTWPNHLPVPVDIKDFKGVPY